MKRLIAAFAAAVCLTACSHPTPAASASANDTFLAQNAKAPGVVTLPSGLQYKIIASGPADGAHPCPADEVKVNYEGKTIDGKVFDSSFQRGVPADLPLNGLIPGWIEALQLMRPGDEWTIYLPPKLAYGDDPPPGAPIPPGAVLIFRLQLLGVLRHDGPPGG